MKLIKPSFEIFEQGPGLQGIYEAIERAGRTCYKSQAKYQYRNPHTNEVYAPDFVGTWKVDDNRIGVTTTAEDFYNKEGIFIKESATAKGFVDRMIASQHYAMLEHGTVYLKTPAQYNYDGLIDFYSRNPYSRILEHKEPYKSKEWKKAGFYITTNLRVLVENNRLEDLELLCEPTELHEKRVAVRFTTSNSIMREFTRHRVMSFAVESTRYCNYSKDKFNNEITFIVPYWVDDIDMENIDNYLYNHEYTLSGGAVALINSLFQSEQIYLKLIRDGVKPQEAREVLPLATKCDMVMTGFVSDWRHFFDLRARGTTGAPHPDAKALAEPLMGEFYKRGYIK